jgi:hypothetical protein
VQPAAPPSPFEDLPAALAHLDAGGALGWCNAAARALLATDAARGALARVLFARLGDGGDGPIDLEGCAHLPALRVRARRDATGWVLALEPADDLLEARATAARSAELLDLAREFGRLGVWERDIPSLAGTWDAQVSSFWGYPAEPREAPPVEEAARRVADADRDALLLRVRESMQCSGRYSHRFGIRRADGTLRRIHSQWIVKDGPDGRPARMLGLLMDESEPFRMAQGAGEIESQLALAVDLGGIAVWRHDLRTHRLHYNEQAWRVLGIESRPEGLAIEEVRSLIHPDDLPQVLASAQAALSSSKPTDMEARYRRSDGTWRDVLTRRITLRDGAGTPIAFVGVAMDVTERVEQTRQAADTLRQFELVTRTAGIGHWSVRGRGPARWSETMFALFGLPPSEPVPAVMSWVDVFVHPDDRALVRDSYAQWMAGEADSIELAFRILRPDGSERQFVSHTRRERSQREDDLLVFGVVVDITERRSVEQALRRAGERIALATRAVSLGTWELELATGRVFWDEAMWALRGLPPRADPPDADERMSYVHPEDRERVAAYNQKSAPAAGALQHEFRVVRPDGTVRWLASRSLWLFDEAGAPIRRMGVNWDVTELREAQAARQEREIALRESQAKSRFLARMSHELRTPLNAVLGFAQLLLADEADGARTDLPGASDRAGSRRRRLEHIHGAGRHLLALINDVLDLASLQSGELRIDSAPLALAPLVAETLALLGPAHSVRGAPARVRVLTGATNVAVLADATRLRQVLLNLLSNAVKYNREGGEVMLSAGVERGQVLIEIADTGHGMEPAQLRQLFEPFNRLGRNDTVEGHGIGLAIVKALVEGMRGSIAVSSTPGVGTRFELRLPAPGVSAGTLADATPRTPTRAGPPTAAAPLDGTAGARAMGGRVHRVLYIEDNPVNALIVGQLLERRHDIQLRVAEDGTRGVAQAGQWQPELILLDMQLPDFSGVEVMRRLRERPETARIPCIAVSANAMPEDIEAALRAGAADYWTKPLDFKAFLAALDRLFGTG